MKEMEITNDELMAWGEKKFDEMQNMYLDIYRDYEAYRERENENRDIRDRSIINIRVRRRSPYAINAIWHWSRFYKVKGEWKVRTNDINKGRGPKTPYDRLSKRAKVWEIDEAWEAEKKLAEIRKMQKEMGNIIAAFRRLKKIEDQMDATDFPD